MAAQIWFKTLVLAYHAANGSGHPTFRHGQTLHPSLSTTLCYRQTACYSLTARGAQLPLNKFTTVCCPGSTMVERAPRWHQVSRNSAHLQTKNSSYLILNVSLCSSPYSIWWSWCTWFLQCLICIHKVECTDSITINTHFYRGEVRKSVCQGNRLRRGNTQFVVLRAEMLKSAKTFCFRRVLLPFTAAFTAHFLCNSWDERRRAAGSCNWFASPAETHTHTHTHTQVTGKQNCHDDGTSLFKQSADSWSSRVKLGAG